VKITIVENEMYLAQSIAAKFNYKGYRTEIFNSVYDAMHKSDGDIYLISTNLPGQNSDSLIRKFKEKTIILIVSYHSSTTVSIPLQLGANDYIMKPFRIEELEQKIEHYKEFHRLRTSIDTYQSYMEYFLRDIGIANNIKKVTLPIIIKTNYTIYIDKLVMEYSQSKNKIFTFIPLMSKDWKQRIKASGYTDFLYISNLQVLKKMEREQLFEMIAQRQFIVSTTTSMETPYPTIELNSETKLYDGGEIMSIEDYIQFTIKTFQNQFPDTVLSKKLGFSRKSLHERRKKYNIYKTKINA